jgi:hypothetical protein
LLGSTSINRHWTGMDGKYKDSKRVGGAFGDRVKLPKTGHLYVFQHDRSQGKIFCTSL